MNATSTAPTDVSAAPLPRARGAFDAGPPVGRAMGRHRADGGSPPQSRGRTADAASSCSVA